MLFTDPIFLFYFLPFGLFIMRQVTRQATGREFPALARVLIFGLTTIFYGFREPWWLVPFIICIFFDFFWASRIHRSQSARARRLWLSLSVMQNLCLLGIFKYRAFILDNLGALGLTGMQWLRLEIQGEPIGLPAGISFYTFESLSFVIDVYRRDILPPKKVSEFFGFIGMFPRFVAGPIVRYRDMVSQFRCYAGMQLEAGLFLFIYGLFLKVIFADNFEVFTRYAFDRSGQIDFLGAWIGSLSYTFHIYFDFSGYSLMAIGLGRALGFQFPTNFNRPYLATSAQDFWRRWHISLSSWLRDYLYISLGGSRHGKLRTMRNLLITMLLGGLWHGAAWHFVAWGAFHGAWLAIERAFPIREKWSENLNRKVTFVVVVIGWVIFRSENGIGEIGEILSAMFWPRNFAFNPEGLVLHPISLAACFVGIWHCFVFEKRVDALALEQSVVKGARQVVAALAMLGTALFFGFSERSIPFIYFQF